jgi:hypothetical protein
MSARDHVEIIFLLVGLIFVALGVVIIVCEVRARLGTQPVNARVIGLSLGRSKKQGNPSFHSVAEYVGSNGRIYYVESSVGSSVPLHAVGDSVTVLVRPTESEKAVFKSILSYVFGSVLAALGLASIAAFWLTYRTGVYSASMALIVLAVLGLRIKNAWRKQPLSLQAWNEYKKQALSPRVFTDVTKSEITWADPASIVALERNYEKSNRFAIPALFILGFTLLFLSHYSYRKTEAFLQNAKNASGRVVELRERDSSDGGSSTYAAVVEYRDDNGETRQFIDSFSSNPPVYHSGEDVSVLYNRDDPREVQIDRGRTNYWLTGLLGGLGGLFTLLGLISNRRRPSRSGLAYRSID